jgi:hypothetical protein
MGGHVITEVQRRFQYQKVNEAVEEARRNA